MEALIVVNTFAITHLSGITHFRECHGYLTSLAKLGKPGGIETLSFSFHFCSQLPARSVVLIERVRILFAEPIHLFCSGCPGVECSSMSVLIENPPCLMTEVFFFLLDSIGVVGHFDAVALQVFEQSTGSIFEVEFPGFLPRHDLLRQHVIHHHRHQCQ